MRNPVFGTGVDTPLGQQDPSRAAEAAYDIRMALNLAIPRDAIANQILNGYAKPATITIAYTAPEYNHTLLQPFQYNITLAKQWMEKAGYSYGPTQPTTAPADYTSYIGIAIIAIILIAGLYVVNTRKKRKS